MELLNALQKFNETDDSARAITHEALQSAVLMLSPVVPHVTHALWFALGSQRAVTDELWPTVDSSALVRDEIEMVVQVNGKLRSRMTVPLGLDDDAIRALALADPVVVRFVADSLVRKVIVVPSKLVNVVI